MEAMLSPALMWRHVHQESREDIGEISVEWVFAVDFQDNEYLLRLYSSFAQEFTSYRWMLLKTESVVYPLPTAKSERLIHRPSPTGVSKSELLIHRTPLTDVGPMGEMELIQMCQLAAENILLTPMMELAQRMSSDVH